MSSNDILIEADRTEGQYWHDLWRYRELLYFLAWRDVAVRYKQTVIGIAWAVVRPLLTMTIFVVVFGAVAKLPSGGEPYAILVCAGLLPWQLFSGALTEASSSLVSNASLVSKIYFPRLLVPVSAIATSLIDFLVSLSILAGLMIWYGHVPTWRMALLPVFVLMALTAATGIGVGMAALNVRFRDFRYIIPFVIQIGLYASPVGFRSEVVPEQYRLAYSLNPMVGVIDGFRWCIAGEGTELHLMSLTLSIAIIVACCMTGIWYFRRTERTIADIV